MQYAHLFSYTIIGDPGVRKSCLERQFTGGAFPEVHEPTIGAEFGTRTIAVDDKRVKLYIWDMAGHESFICATKQYYYRTACIILVYDITRRETFDHIAIWLDRARKQSRDGVTLVLIGNKCDLSHMRAVSYEEGRKFAKKHNLVFMEASAKTTQNVEEIFFMTAETIYTEVEDGDIDVSERAASLEHDHILFLLTPLVHTLQRPPEYCSSRRRHNQRRPAHYGRVSPPSTAARRPVIVSTEETTTRLLPL